MKTSELLELEPAAAHCHDVVRLPYGLLGFERVKNYSLLARPGEEPFLWLQMLREPRHAFLVLPPAVVAAHYQPDIPDEDAEYLELADPADALILNIVTLHRAGSATINLKGPVIINRRSWIGKQVIPANAAEYSVRHPLPVS